MGWLSQHRLALNYGATAFSIAIINNIWVTYNYPFFLKTLGTGPWFVGAQIVFGLWNTLNDPLFGWFSDQTDKGSAVSRRIPFIWKGGALLSVAFAIAWWPWSSESDLLAGFHFLVSLCLYDTALTVCEVNHASLLADISPSPAERARCTQFSSLFSVAGSFVLLAAHHLWVDGSNLGQFRVFCGVVALIALAGFRITYEAFRNHMQDQRPVSLSPQAKCQSKSNTQPGMRQFASQLSAQNNFKWFTIVRFIQVFTCTFEKNHLAMFLSVLVGPSLSQGSRGMLICLSFLLPHIIVAFIAGTRWAKDVHRVVAVIFALKILLSIFVCVVALGTGRAGEPWRLHSPGWLLTAVYLCTARVLTECVCRFFPLVVAQLVDEDSALNNRPKSMAASIVGLSAMFAKPAESVAPIVGWHLLKSSAPTTPQITKGANDQQTFLVLLMVLPLISGTLQMASWSNYTLRGVYLRDIRERISSQNSIRRLEEGESSSSSSSSRSSSSSSNSNSSFSNGSSALYSGGAVGVGGSGVVGTQKRRAIVL